jgi:hypothetical protein
VTSIIGYGDSLWGGTKKMLPEWLDFAFSENAAVAMYRGLQGPTASWGELIASSQAIVGFFQEFDVAKIDELYNMETFCPWWLLREYLMPPRRYLPVFPKKIGLT